MFTSEPVPVLVLNGPTASGKTQLAVDLAHGLSASGRPTEIVNADSMLVYRGMDIGTAKPTLAERGGVPHHLIDILDVTQTANVADFQDRARAAIADCRARGVIPILVGGSALYVRAIVDVFEFPGTDPLVRQRWEQELDHLGPEALHHLLQQRDAAVAADILPGNGRRIVRALEVLELQGSFTQKLPAYTYALDGVIQVGVELDRELLDARIAMRVERMWERGFVAEVEQLRHQGIEQGLTASRALGYRQILAALRGEDTLDGAAEKTVVGTRRFARKQLGWFRRDSRITWFPAGGEDNVAQIMELLKSHS
ncbi:MAG: tRNA (adenosine(37)-N6)-dimethylallyltransferase MiaA [Propionibacteriaceae bacterium]